MYLLHTQDFFIVRYLLFIGLVLFVELLSAQNNELPLYKDAEIEALNKQFEQYYDSLKNDTINQDTIAFKEVIFFKESFASFLAKTKAYKRPYFIYFNASWCGPCKKLKKETFRYEPLVDYIDYNMLALSVDTESFDGIELSQKYQVEHLPTLIFFDEHGQQKGKIDGYMQGYSFLNKLKSFYE